MKNWVRRHPYMALAFGYVIFFVFATAVWLVVSQRSLVDALISGFMYTLIYWLFAMFQLRNVRKTKRRLDEHGQFKAFIRYPESRAGSLSEIWNQGVATPDAGSIRFQPAVYDSLEPSGRPTDLKVQRVLPDRRKIIGKERKYLPAFGYLAVTLLTDGGKVELAASPDALDKLTEVVASGPA
ncbi:hypothetical protein [Arthrobacter ruber]|uniref:hypothetical protein n=1 Tax=Arthrobacter ruber TaxID=1258893 RepID=UPI001300118E|nr:hypothetical protein [Arthrobacter ruber]